MTTPTYDLSYLKEMSGGCAEFEADMIQTFVDQSPQFMEGIKEGLAQQDYEAIRFHAHKLKSSLAMLQIHPTGEQVATLEQEAAQQVNTDTMPQRIEDIDKGLAIIIQQLSTEYDG